MEINWDTVIQVIGIQHFLITIQRKANLLLICRQNVVDTSIIIPVHSVVTDRLREGLKLYEHNNYSEIDWNI